MNDNDDDKKVFVGYFDYSIPPNTLKQMFAKFGQIKSFWKSPSVPKTFAFVVYRTADDAKNAVQQLNGIFIDKDRVKVNLAKDKDQEFLANISAESCSSCSEDECCLNKENGHKHKKNNEMIKLNKTNPLKRSKSAIDFSDQINDKKLNSHDDTKESGKGKKSKFRYFNQKINPELESYSIKPAKQSKNDLNKLNKRIDQQNSNKFNRKLNDEQNSNKFNRKLNDGQNSSKFANQFNNQQNLFEFANQFNYQQNLTEFANQFNNQFINPFAKQYNNQNRNQFNGKNSFNLKSNQYYNPFYFSKASTSSNSSPQNLIHQNIQHRKSTNFNKSALTIDLTVASPMSRVNTVTGEIDIEDTLNDNELDTSIKKFEVITIDD